MNQYGFDPRNDPNNATWVNWKNNQISNFVKDARILIKNYSLNLDLSCAVFSTIDGAIRSYQRWDDWVNKNYVDFIIPMNYEIDNSIFEGNVKHEIQIVNKKVPILIGLGIWLYHDDITKFQTQINITRQYDADGWVLFRNEYEKELIPNIPPYPSPPSTQSWYENPYIFAIILIALIVFTYFFSKT